VGAPQIPEKEGRVKPALRQRKPLSGKAVPPVAGKSKVKPALKPEAKLAPKAGKKQKVKPALKAPKRAAPAKKSAPTAKHGKRRPHAQ